MREGLGILRVAGLVETRRGREGGSFVVRDDIEHRGILTARLRGLAQVELSDMAVYFGAILAGAAERAAERASPDDAANLAGWLGSADFSTAAAARTNQGGFLLELAVLSQSARLVREQIRLQAEFGPLLLLGLADESARVEITALNQRIVRAVARQRGARAREAAGELVEMLARRLLAAKARVERGGALDEPHAD